MIKMSELKTIGNIATTELWGIKFYSTGRTTVNLPEDEILFLCQSVDSGSQEHSPIEINIRGVTVSQAGNVETAGELSLTFVGRGDYEDVNAWQKIANQSVNPVTKVRGNQTDIEFHCLLTQYASDKVTPVFYKKFFWCYMPQISEGDNTSDVSEKTFTVSLPYQLMLRGKNLSDVDSYLTRESAGLTE